MTEYTNFYTPSNAEFYAHRPYEQLDRHSQEARFLQFEPFSKSKQAITCTILPKRPLSSFLGQYIAISYAAGDYRKTQQITVNGLRFNAFETLYDAVHATLCRYAKTNPRRPLILWTDQICINQSDPTERAHQVHLMKMIYQNADNVFVHLPLKVDGGNLTRALRPMISQLSQERRTTAPDDLDIGPLSLLVGSFDLSIRLLSQNWWQRAWIYQEFIVAQRVDFLLGKDTRIAWSEFKPLLEQLTKLNHHRAGQFSQAFKANFATLERAWPAAVEQALTEYRKDHKHSVKTSWYTKRWFCPLIWRYSEGMNEYDDECCDYVVFVIWSIGVILVFIVPDIFLTIFGGIMKSIVQPKRSESGALAEERARTYWELDPDGHYTEGSRKAQRPPRADEESSIGSEPCLKCESKRMQEKLPDWEDLTRSLETSVSAVKYLSEAKPKLQAVGAAKLSDLTRHARNVLSSDPRDKVYAFLGLADDYGIVPDYTAHNTVARTFIDTTKAMIVKEQDMAFIVETVGLRNPKHVLPSWVPDLMVPERDDALVDSYRKLSWCAGGDFSRGTTFRDIQSRGTQDYTCALSIKGKRLDSLNLLVKQKGTSLRWFRGRLEYETNGLSQTGDEVWILRGLFCPVVLRRFDDWYVLVSCTRPKALDKGELSRILTGELASDATVPWQRLAIR